MLFIGVWLPELAKPRPSPPLPEKLRFFSITPCAMDWATKILALTTTNNVIVNELSNNCIAVLRNLVLSALAGQARRYSQEQRGRTGHTSASRYLAYIIYLKPLLVYRPRSAHNSIERSQRAMMGIEKTH